jgi:DNA-3-methyladenine glycosylase I
MQPVADARPRCWWAREPLEIAYHDSEWGVPCHDDGELFERLMLEGFQAGLSWSTILRKRETFSLAFDGWDASRIARYGPRDVERLLSDPGIIRNRLKVQAAIKNASAFLALQREHGSFDAFIWSFTGGATLIVPPPAELGDVPATRPESDAMSKALKKAGMSFVGSTICYAFMQSAGMVNDHLVTCFRRDLV